jgi:hypothetical protein
MIMGKLRQRGDYSQAASFVLNFQGRVKAAGACRNNSWMLDSARLVMTRAKFGYPSHQTLRPTSLDENLQRLF